MSYAWIGVTGTTSGAVTLANDALSDLSRGGVYLTQGIALEDNSVTSGGADNPAYSVSSNSLDLDQLQG